MSSADKKKQGKRTSVIRIPAKLLVPVANFLKGRLKHLEKRKRKISKEDPFADTSRLTDNASPDSDAYEQFGHAKTSAIKEQVDKRIIQIKKALTRIKIGKYGICEDCGKMIDTDRLMIYPEATFCANCQKKREG
jgi:RNA polymerase-binding transcription factor DksA